MGRIVGNKKGDPPDVKFWRSVDVRPDGCWNWTASTTVFGHGVFAPSQFFKIRAHRYAWELIRGPIPAGMILCHHCDNPRCVRPDHLFVGTQADNMRDAAQKKRTMRRERHIRAKLNQQTADEIRAIREATGLSYLKLGTQFGVSGGTARLVCLRAARGGWA